LIRLCIGVDADDYQEQKKKVLHIISVWANMHWRFEFLR
jgi:hypothetical protein